MRHNDQYQDYPQPQCPHGIDFVTCPVCGYRANTATPVPPPSDVLAVLAKAIEDDEIEVIYSHTIGGSMQHAYARLDQVYALIAALGWRVEPEAKRKGAHI